MDESNVVIMPAKFPPRASKQNYRLDQQTDNLHEGQLWDSGDLALACTSVQERGESVQETSIRRVGVRLEYKDPRRWRNLPAITFMGSRL